MGKAPTAIEMMLLVKILCNSFNKPNIQYFNGKAIIAEMQGKSDDTVYQILEKHFGEFVTFTKEPPKNMITI